MTLRAIIIGLGGAWLLAYLTPWNDWAAGNSQVHGSYLPPVIIVVLAILCGWVNPRLGAKRLRPPEIATVLALLLVVGSISSMGLMRHFPTILVSPQHTLDASSSRSTWISGDGNLEHIDARHRELAARVVGRHDRNGDQRLDPAERAGMGLLLADPGLGVLDADGLVAAIIGTDDRSSPVPAHLHAGGTGRRPGSIEDERIAGGYLRGQHGMATPPGTTFVLVDGTGQRQHLTYQDGATALALLADGHAIADPGSDGRATQLLSTDIGEAITIDGKALRLERRIAPGIPWKPWLHGLLAWSPAILALVAGALALAGIVRHQWIHNERLPMPIANVLGALIGSDGDGSRPSIFSSRGLWIAAAAVFLIHFTRMLFTFGYSPFDIPLELRLQSFSGIFAPLDRSPDVGYLLNPHLYLTIVAMAFLMTTEVSGSLWGLFVVVNLLAGVAIINGITVSAADLDHGAVGASAMLCVLILWVGRRYYLATLAAACGRPSSPEAAQAAPWIWVLMGSCVVLVLFMVGAGIPVFTALAVTLILHGTILALARMVAETGSPFSNFGGNGRLSGIILALFGPTSSAAVLMPLLMVGHVVGLGDRERLLPHVLHGLAVQERAGGRPGSLGLMVTIAIACLGCAVLAFCAMIAIGYHWGSVRVDNWTSNSWGWALSQGEALLSNPAQAERHAHHVWTAYGIGALVFAILGLSRLRWSGFPINPIALVVIGGWATKMGWASFAVGWLAKLLVLRYGGQSLYRRLLPVAIGLLLGEAAMVTVGMAVGLVRAALGMESIDLRILP